jgi:ubiquinone/menaquinone biosynthesis C-methylase UbiE
LTTASGTGKVGSSLQGVRDRRDREAVEPAAIEKVVSLTAKRVMDVGCGTGRLTAFAARQAAFVYAFDPSADSVEEARSAVATEDRERVRFAVHDAEALDVPRERFDLALCGWSL